MRIALAAAIALALTWSVASARPVKWRDPPCVPYTWNQTPIAYTGPHGETYLQHAVMSIPPSHPLYGAYMSGTPIAFRPCLGSP